MLVVQESHKVAQLIKRNAALQTIQPRDFDVCQLPGTPFFVVVYCMLVVNLAVGAAGQDITKQEITTAFLTDLMDEGVLFTLQVLESGVHQVIHPTWLAYIYSLGVLWW